MVYVLRTKEWALARAGERTEEEGSPGLHFPRCPLPASFLAPGPLPIGCTAHSPTISAPMNRLRRTLTNQNQRCRNRHGVRPGYSSTGVPCHWILSAPATALSCPESFSQLHSWCFEAEVRLAFRASPSEPLAFLMFSDLVLLPSRRPLFPVHLAICSLSLPGALPQPSVLPAIWLLGLVPPPAQVTALERLSEPTSARQGGVTSPKRRRPWAWWPRRRVMNTTSPAFLRFPGNQCRIRPREARSSQT